MLGSPQASSARPMTLNLKKKIYATILLGMTLSALLYSGVTYPGDLSLAATQMGPKAYNYQSAHLHR